MGDDGSGVTDNDATPDNEVLVCELQDEQHYKDESEDGYNGEPV